MFFALHQNGTPWAQGVNDADAPDGALLVDEAAWQAATEAIQAGLEVVPEIVDPPPLVEFTCACGRHYALPPNAQPTYIDGGP